MDYGWLNGTSAGTYTIATTNTSGWVYPATTYQPAYKARLVLDDVQIEPPVPQSEIERLMDEVEQVCALAR